jgi:hypothetical protein
MLNKTMLIGRLGREAFVSIAICAINDLNYSF